MNFVKNNFEKLLLPFLPPGNSAIGSFMNLRQGKPGPLVICLNVKKTKSRGEGLIKSIYTPLPYHPIKQEYVWMMWNRFSKLGVRHEMKLHVQRTEKWAFDWSVYTEIKLPLSIQPEKKIHPPAE